MRVLQSDETRFKEVPFKSIYTDTNMCDPVLRQEIERSIQEIYRLRDISPPLPEDWELALELGEDDTGQRICSYYFVRLSTRCLFWLHDFDLKSVLADLRGVTEKAHIRKSAPAPAIHRAKRMTRPGITSPILVSLTK